MRRDTSSYSHNCPAWSLARCAIGWGAALADMDLVTDPALRIRVWACPTGERWQLRRQSRLLAAGLLLTAVVLACTAVAALSSVAHTTFEHDLFTGIAIGCSALATLALGLAINAARSGLRLDEDGLTCRGLVLRRRLRWSDIVAFTSGVEEHLPNRPAAIALAKLRDGRYVTLPGTRVEGLRWNLDEHKRVAAAIAATLEEHRRATAIDRG